MNEKLIVVMYDLITICGLFILILISISDNGGYVNSYEIDEVTSLPGWNKKLSSRHFSGFLDGGSVDGDDEKSMKLHYWFVESEVNPESKPLVFWFNGGPGASSLYGMLVELGPYLLSDISLSGPEYEQTKIPQLIYNPHGWQKIANIVAISMPPPIGYSYCNDNVEATGDDCTPAVGYWNDTSTALVTYNSVLSFFKKFPHFQKHEIFLSGESYAGVYIPMIVKNILASIDTHPINLKGFAVGDACTPPNICGPKQMGPFYNIEFLFGISLSSLYHYYRH
jgi:cathepsin A (carboxypeptidase C)